MGQHIWWIQALGESPGDVVHPAEPRGNLAGKKTSGTGRRARRMRARRRRDPRWSRSMRPVVTPIRRDRIGRIQHAGKDPVVAVDAPRRFAHRG